uniref:Uncharacterized protein n=1 Tax=Paulinella micropora TaxID=1928728 RepID=A0A385I053_9EUKA|nr:hypothetical protein PMNZ_359 [Paulinella micropora]AXY63303.1 hypothetical protein PMNZ_359 [Paulinella micropora]
MSSPESLFQASLNRLVFRLGSSLTQTTANISTLLQEAPEKACQAWELFIEEVRLEAEMMEEDRNIINTESGSDKDFAIEDANYTLDTAQDQVDQLRLRIAILLNQFRDSP